MKINNYKMVAFKRRKVKIELIKERKMKCKFYEVKEENRNSYKE